MIQLRAPVCKVIVWSWSRAQHRVKTQHRPTQGHALGSWRPAPRGLRTQDCRKRQLRWDLRRTFQEEDLLHPALVF